MLEPNIIKIKGVFLYVGFTSYEGVVKGLAVKKLLDEINLPYKLEMFCYEIQYPDLFEQFNTWTFDKDYKSYTFTDFPFLIWEEQYDNYEVMHCVAFNVEEVKASRLLHNIDLIIMDK